MSCCAGRAPRIIGPLRQDTSRLFEHLATQPGCGFIYGGYPYYYGDDYYGGYPYRCYSPGYGWYPCPYYGYGY
jgi:hypothetical protein